ncbi:MAG: 3-phosphoglycerate dehydrogenase [Lachnospiraceae bacterium]|nr:3-phosphoglycerate dehydrogenase [Lachnospiraceae bacterium]
MFKYTTLNEISKVGIERFGDGFKYTKKIEEANGILVRSAKMHDMEFSEKLLAIARAGAGVNNIPLEDCAKKGIVVFNTPGANANGVKELVIAGMLMASRDIVEGVDWVRDNKKDKSIASDVEKEKKQFAGTELEGKKLGIIGLGAIGVRVANAAVYMDMDVYGYDPYVSVENAWHLSRKITHVTDLNDIYKNCDFITIHVPLMKQTEGMIDKKAIARMKKGVILINMARDQLVDEAAVLKAIDEGKIRRYVSDFPNPLIAGHKNCITTPHLGASTEESEENSARMAVDALRDYLENGNIKNSVNYPNCDMGVCMTASRIAILHENKANMITQNAAIMGAEGINIAELANKSRGDIAYTLVDLDSVPTAKAIRKLEEVDGVYRVRVIK